MSKTFRPWKIDQPLLLPPCVQDFVGEAHLARFVTSLVAEHLDLREITATYGSERGQPPFDPMMMTALLVYAYCSGVYSSRRIARAARERVDFMSIVGLDAPDFRTTRRFLCRSDVKEPVLRDEMDFFRTRLNPRLLKRLIACIRP